MSRDMQIGLLLAVGFLALVGGVLYYRIEHPDELEQYLNGDNLAQATSPVATKPEDASARLAQNDAIPSGTNLPPAPSSAPPKMELVENTSPASTPPASVPTPAGNVLQTSANNQTTPMTPPSGGAPVVPPANPSMPALDLTLDTKPTETKPPAMPATPPPVEEKKPEAAPTTTRTSLPAEPPAAAPSLNLPPPPGGAPAFALDTPAKPPPSKGNGDLAKVEEKKVEEKKPEDKKPEEKKPPVDVVIKPETTDKPPVMTPPSTTPPGLSLPPSPANSSITLSDAPPKTTAPDLTKSNELPQPPTVTPSGGITFDNKPAATPPPGNTPPPAANNSPLMGNNNPTPPPAATPRQEEKPANEADGMRTFAPRVALGKPLTESEAALREKRWADQAGAPAPIIPSSADSRKNNNTAPATTLGDRRVVRDTYIPTERAQRGETFSSLSQRLYGDTNYSQALAAFNKEEGFVKMDQPEANEWVAKPNREILDQRYPQMIRRLTPGTVNPNNSTLAGKTPEAVKPANVSYPTYRVGKGEQLFEVAKKTLGDGYRWSEIYALNKDQLRESTELRPDMVLKLPTDAKK